MKAYDVHEHENVVFDDRSAVIGDHGLVDDDQRLDESLATDWPRYPPPPPRRSPTRCRRRTAPIWPPPVDDRRRSPFVLIVGGRGPDGGRSSVIGAARVRRVPATVVVCTRTQNTDLRAVAIIRALSFSRFRLISLPVNWLITSRFAYLLTPTVTCTNTRSTRS